MLAIKVMHTVIFTQNASQLDIAVQPVGIFHRLERQYSPKRMYKIGSLSLQSPEVPRDFVRTMKRTMQQCQS